jgi:hypothetical protein
MMNVLFNIFLGTQKEDLLKEYYFMWDQKRLKFLMELPIMRQSKNSNGGRCESAGINRHRVGDERALHERRSCSIVAPSHARATVRLHVKR